MRPVLKFLVCDNEEVFLSKYVGALPSQHIARGLHNLFVEHPRCAAYAELSDTRKFVGMIVDEDLEPVRALRRNLIEELGKGSDWQPSNVLLTEDDSGSEQFYQNYRQVCGDGTLHHATNPEAAWAMAARGQPMRPLVADFLRVRSFSFGLAGAAKIIPFPLVRSAKPWAN